MNKYNDRKYRFGRNLSTFVVNTTLKPLIVGKENVEHVSELSKQFVVCGNHNHVWDQFPVMCATKVTIHWMAKQEYFEGKLGPVFKFMGCIPVDRKNNPHQSKEIALDYLSSGSTVGLFPEGTRNAPKEDYMKMIYSDLNTSFTFEEYKILLKNSRARLSQLQYLKQLFDEGKITYSEYSNGLFSVDALLRTLVTNKTITQDDYEDSLLLPFKTGAVDMAMQTNSPILPFAVTGDYTLDNDNLIVNFGEPFYVNNCSKEEANNILRTKVKKLLVTNLGEIKTK